MPHSNEDLKQDESPQTESPKNEGAPKNEGTPRNEGVPSNDGSMTPREQPNNPMHGIKLAELLEYLVEVYGWEELGSRINIRCFNSDPSIKSSLKFLRKTLWAREKVERLYLRSIKKTPHVRP